MIKPRLINCVLGLTPFLLMGCSLQADDSQTATALPAPVPALVTEPSAESINELEIAIANLLKMEQVTIADNAFTRNSRLSLERAPHTDPNGQLLMGRSFELPEIVQLWISGDKCFLTDSNNHRSPPLTHTLCQAE
ncbi:hypothetical protein [Shewanella psychrotolerans]|uniref:hypothetical protein n=1 Tax=Shewanella psychrotolerans TaxID=2864206 RepID=UPI001C6586D5|nr:hypothetical protein [Shewanella psychrotolerans]QYK00408.1 hypothetical protein K0I62_13490 [Shewanella psychrotolerans]